MSTERSHHFLDAENSENDESQGYDSEVDLIQKGGRASKRQKTENIETSQDEAKTHDDEGESENAGQEAVESSNPRSLKKKNLVATEEAIKKSGVVYLSRIPPFMKPRKLRSLLEPYGKLNRIYMAEEDAAARKKRVKGGGNRRRLYLEGWVEFVNKKDAKRVCELLNGRNIGGKKRAYYYDSMWTLLYLKGFKWHHLTDQIAAENAARESRMRAEISKAQRENKEYVANIQRSKMLEHMEAKADAKITKDEHFSLADQDETEANTRPGPHQTAKLQPEGIPRIFNQTAAIAKARKINVEQSDGITKNLGSLF